MKPNSAWRKLHSLFVQLVRNSKIKRCRQNIFLKARETELGWCIWYRYKFTFTVSGDLLLFSGSVTSDSLWPHGLQHTKRSCLSITISQSLIKLTSIESMMPSNHLVLCCPILLLSSTYPSIRVLCNKSVLHIRSPSTGASASVLSVNIYCWFPLGWTGWRDSQEPSPTPPFENISSLSLSLLYGQTLASIHDYWKNHSFDYTDLCQQSNAFAF